jgi:hypothetical protein
VESAAFVAEGSSSAMGVRTAGRRKRYDRCVRTGSG